jgi:hypothetical protein
VETTEDLIRLAMDVLDSEKVPSDEDLGEGVLLAAAELQHLVATRGSASRFVSALDVYVQARLKRPGTVTSS